MSVSSKICSRSDRSMASAHISSNGKMEYGDLLNGVLVMGSFLGFCFLFWFCVIKLIELI